MTSLNAGVWVGKRSTNAWLAAKLTASFLLASVRSTAGRRNDPPRRVPTAWSSYAAQASYIAVCTMARARATIGGPGFVTRIACSAALSHCSTTLSEALASWFAATAVARFPGEVTSRLHPAKPSAAPVATSRKRLRAWRIAPRCLPDSDATTHHGLHCEIVVVVAELRVACDAIERSDHGELQPGNPRATGRDHHGKGDVAEGRLHTRAKRVQHLHGGCAAEAAPV